MDELIKILTQSDNHLLSVIIGIVVISMVVTVIRSVFRIILPIVVIGLVMVVFLGHSPNEVMNRGKQFLDQGSTFVQEVLPFFHFDDSKDPFSESDVEKYLDENEEESEKETLERNGEMDINKF